MKKFILLSCLISTVSYANHESGGLLPVAAVFVDFRSFGAGIDTNSKQIFKALVSEERLQGHVMYETLAADAREGEVRNCIELPDALIRKNFIRKLAPSIVEDRDSIGAVRTGVYSGTNCDIFETAVEEDLR